jgi:hypothetical protein
MPQLRADDAGSWVRLHELAEDPDCVRRRLRVRVAENDERSVRRRDPPDGVAREADGTFLLGHLHARDMGARQVGDDDELSDLRSQSAMQRSSSGAGSWTTTTPV